MRYRWLWVCLILWCLPLVAQDATAPTLTTPSVTATLYAGPGPTYSVVSTLVPGQLVNIVERNRMGDWLHVRLEASNGTVTLDGWVPYVNMQLLPTLDLFAMVAENDDLPDGDATRVENAAEATLYRFPVLPPIPAAMQVVFERGQALGRNPASVTRVGDSLLSSDWYLSVMRNNDYRLGRYSFLEPDVRFFGVNMHTSVAVQKGLNTYTVQDTLFAGRGCQPSETPLTCEYRQANPMAAFILFGPNDVLINDPQAYEENLSAIVEQSMELGVIPILMTFSTHPNYRFYDHALDYNIIIANVAAAHDVPLLNMWVASRTLPQYGLEGDLIHLKNSGYRYLNFESNLVERSGVTLLNLLSLRLMHELRLALDIPLPPELQITPTAVTTARPTELPPIPLAGDPVQTSTPRP